MSQFSESLFYCSALSQIIGNGKGKKRLPSVLMAEISEKLAYTKSKYDPLAIKNIKHHESRRLRIIDYEGQIAELQKFKDEDFLPETAKNYIARIYAYLKYQKWGDPTGEEMKPTIEKGTLLEPESIKLLSQIDGCPYAKNDQRLTDDFICGIPDILSKDYVADVKTSYDINSFFPYLHKDLSARYWWQMQGYLRLTGYKSGIVAFCLLPLTPRRIDEIVEEIMSKTQKYTEQELRDNFDYDTIPALERCIKFQVNRDERAIDLIPQRVQSCRNYLIGLEERRTGLRIASYGLSDHEDTDSPDEDQE